MKGAFQDLFFPQYSSNDGSLTVDNDMNLMITNVTKSNEGVYTCVAMSPAGSNRVTVYVSVLSKQACFCYTSIYFEPNRNKPCRFIFRNPTNDVITTIEHHKRLVGLLKQSDKCQPILFTSSLSVSSFLRIKILTYP